MIKINSKTNLYVPIVKLALPATEEEIERAFRQAQISDRNDCNIYTIENASEFLGSKLAYETPFDGNAINELNFLAAQINALDDYYRHAYQGMIMIEKPETLKDYINLAANLESVIYFPVTSKEELGELLVENMFVDIPEQFIKYLDYEKVAEEHLLKHRAMLSRFGYIEDTRTAEEIVEIYDGVTLPPTNIPEKSRLEQLSDCLPPDYHPEQYADIEPVINELDETEFDKLLAAVEYWTAGLPNRDCRLDADDIWAIISHLDDYNVVATAPYFPDYGMHCLKEQGIADPNILETIDLYEYGYRKLTDNNGILTTFGPVECKNDIHYKEMDAALSAKQEQNMAQTESMRMGGL